MARLSYAAPGVYVEEVPSARQPIAGVGTSTAGFIGYVPNTVYVPVENPEYDPMLTRQLLDFERLSSAPKGSDAPAEAQRAKQLDDLEKDLKARITAMSRLLEEAPGSAGTKSAEALEGKKRDLAELTQRIQDAKSPSQPAPAPAAAKSSPAAKPAQAVKPAAATQPADGAPGGQAAEPTPAPQPAPAAPAGAVPAAAQAETNEGAQDDEDYSDMTPDAKLLKPSMLRPYYLVPQTVKAPEFATKLCTNFTEYTNLFGDFSGFGKDIDGRVKPLYPGHHMLTHALYGFFENGGTKAFVARVGSLNNLAKGLDTALNRFKSIEDVALLAAPGLPKTEDVWVPLQSYCEDAAHQNVFAILDSPGAVTANGDDKDFAIERLKFDAGNSVLPPRSSHAAYYFPHLEVSDPAKRLQDSDPAWAVPPKYRGRTYVAPSGHLAGIYARTDEERGVHKAPANTKVRGALEVKYYVSKPKQELLNPHGVNCIRLINGEVTVWGARTIGGDFNGDSKYIPVRRFLGFLEASIERGTQWVVFEPNEPRLWSKIVLNITSFLTNVWRSGALLGNTPQEAFYVKCDAELNPASVRDLGQVITEIGVAVVRPAEFVIFRISQFSGPAEG